MKGVFRMKHEITAKRLRRALDKSGFSAQELSDKSGVSKASISQYVNGSHKPSNISAQKIGNCLGINPLWIMGFDVCMTEDDKVDNDDLKTLIYIFDKFGYNLKPFDNIGTYMLQHKKDTTYGLLIHSDELNTMLLDISDYIAELISKRFEKTLSMVRGNPYELNAAHERTDIKVTEEMKQHDDAFFDEED